MAGRASGARAGLDSVTRGTLVMLLGTLGFVVENFVSRVLLARSISVHDWGNFSLGLALAGLLASLGSLGLAQAVARNLPFASRDDERRAIVHSSFAVVVPSAIIVSAGMFLLGVALNPSLPALALTVEFFAAAVAMMILSGLIAAVFQGYEDVRPNALFVQILNPTLFIVFLIAAEAPDPFHLGYLQALVAYLGSAAVSLGAIGLYARRRLPRLLPPGDRAPGVSRRLFLFAAPLFVVGVLGVVSQNGDTILLGVFLRNSLGYYTAALSLARLLMVGLGSLAYIFLPVTARFVRSGDHEAVRITYATATKWMILTSLPLFLIFFFLPSRSLGFVYGSDYSVGSTTLKLLVTAAFASTLIGPSTATQVSYGQTRLLMYNTIAAAFADVLLSALLIPPFGTEGAAVAWGVATTLAPALSAVELAVLQDVHPFRAHYLVPLLVTSVPLAVLFLFVPLAVPLWALPLLVGAIALLFLLVVFATGSVDTGDRLLLEVVEGFLGRRVPLVRSLARWRLGERIKEL
ncbi:MAG: oligosaccharide flippase family protein [Thermoplasmata archaeon]|nr:oligosaccharide flippase family protein [Thermoplasmata archaeon]